MTKAVLIVWLITNGAVPTKVDFDSLDACNMAASEIERSPTKWTIVARCVDLGKAS